MIESAVASNVLSTIGAVCWSIQLLPQLILNYRRHNATGLQPTMMMFWAWAGVPLGVYNIVSDFTIALQIQPQILSVLSLLTWVQVYYYEKKWSVARSVAVVLPIAAAMGGIEVSLIFALRIGLQRGVQWPVTLMAVLAALFLALGVLRHYVDIYIHRSVRGVSFVFCGIDALGDLTSLVSLLVAPGGVDVLGCVVYGVELGLWCGVFACGGWFNLRPWLKARRRRSEQQEGMAMHDLPSSTSVFRTTGGEIRGRTAFDRETGDMAISGRATIRHCGI